MPPSPFARIALAGHNGWRWNGRRKCALNCWSGPWPVWMLSPRAAAGRQPCPPTCSPGLRAKKPPASTFCARAIRWWRGDGRRGNQPGDLDLVAWQGPMLCFFEVKTRTARDLNPAEAAVDLHKRNVLRRSGPPIRSATAGQSRSAGAFRRGQRLPGARQTR